jgi:hemoglobin-like flavoprotein
MYHDDPDLLDYRHTLIEIHTPAATDPTGPQPISRGYRVDVTCDRCPSLPLADARTHPATHPGHVVTVVEKFTTTFGTPGEDPPMTDDPGQIAADAYLLGESLELIAPHGDDVVATFYDQLFQRHPQVRDLFPADMTAQRERLLTAIVEVVTNYDQRDSLVPMLREAGARHVGYGAEPAHYDVVGTVLLECLAATAGDAWTAEYEAAWSRMYAFVADSMRAGAAEVTAAA